MSPSLSSVPDDIVHQILARLPKPYHRMVSFLSKRFSDLVRSSRYRNTRRLLNKESLCIFYCDRNYRENWFKLSRKEEDPTENEFVSIKSMFNRRTRFSEYRPSMIVAIGPELFCISKGSSPQSMMWVFDTRSGKIRQGPSSSHERCVRCAAAVESKLYVICNLRDERLYVESFDVKTQRWEQAPVPENMEGRCGVALDRKVCALRSIVEDIPNCYSTVDGSCDFIVMPKEDCWGSTGACVFQNVLFMYHHKMGLSWYDKEEKTWKMVSGLGCYNNVKSVAMGEFYGKLAFLWEEEGEDSGGTKYVWCRMIGLQRIDDAICGNTEMPVLLGTIPCDYKLEACLSVSD